MSLEVTHVIRGSQAEVGVLFLHGLGATSDNLVFLFNELKVPRWKNAIAIFPQAPMKKITLWSDSWRGASWFNINHLNMDCVQEFEGLSDSVIDLKEVIESYQAQYPSVSKWDVIGFSQGGMMALELSQHVQVNKMCLLSTFYPQKKSISLKGVSILQAHGAADMVVPYVIGQDLAKKLESELKSHENDFTFKGYLDLGHSIDKRVLLDMYDFFDA